VPAPLLDPVPFAQRVARHWRANLRLTALLLAVWFGVTFVVTYFGRELSGVFFGWPFSFWVAAQGSLIVYVALVWAYSRAMNRIDRDCGLAEDD
jgi:putative solute:sodium symporter small subunit